MSDFLKLWTFIDSRDSSCWVFISSRCMRTSSRRSLISDTHSSLCFHASSVAVLFSCKSRSWCCSSLRKTCSLFSSSLNFIIHSALSALRGELVFYSIVINIVAEHFAHLLRRMKEAVIFQQSFLRIRLKSFSPSHFSQTGDVILIVSVTGTTAFQGCARCVFSFFFTHLFSHSVFSLVRAPDREPTDVRWARRPTENEVSALSIAWMIREDVPFNFTLAIVNSWGGNLPVSESNDGASSLISPLHI